jgi:tetratricopeptide (TPR) repeat protein
VYVEMTSTRGPRELRVVIENRSYPVGSAVSRVVQLEANKPVRFTLSMPVTAQSTWGQFRLYERGRVLDRLTAQGIGGGSGSWWGSGLPSILLVSRATPDWRMFNQATGNYLAGGGGGQTQPTILPPEKMPTRWIDYTTLDLVLVPLAELEQMPAAARDALVGWALAGGNLLVFGVGTEREKATLDRLLELEHRLPTGAAWRQPKLEDRRAAPPATVAGSTTSAGWPAEARTRLERDGPEAYRRYCTELLERHSPGSANDCNNLAWACVLAPDAVTDHTRLVRLAERAVSASPRSYAYLNTLGVAQYRAGQFSQAILTLNDAVSLHRSGGTPSDWLFLAMAHHRLGNAAEAKQWLDKATGAINENASLAADPETRLFRREAESLINPPEKPAAAAVTDAATTKSADQSAPTTPAAQGAASQATAQIQPYFVVRPFGMGQLVRMSKPDPFPGTEEDWTWVFRTIGSNRMRWVDRHGLTARSGNPDFWNFLIPGVGRAPIGAFQLLISVFALVIGPVNYFVLRRRKRLYFLIITVPSLALLTTALLLGYAIASEGFAVRTRVRSVTLLDQVRGEAASWSRISYYAGLAPAGGLRFSTDTAVYPLDPEDSTPGYRVLDWTEDQHLSGGWLRSRTPTQFLTVSHRQTGEQLAVVADSRGNLRVTNNLGSPIQFLLLADDQGVLYSAQEVAERRATTLDQLDGEKAFEDARQALRKIIQAQRLDVPDEMKTRGPTPSGFWWWMGPARFMSQGLSPDAAGSLLEDSLRKLTHDANELRTLLQPRTYVAVVERLPVIELGVRDTQESGSLYVIWGKY